MQSNNHSALNLHSIHRLQTGVVVMGVAGSGKTELGLALAKLLSLVYVEGDDFHPMANIEKMESGKPLTDTDRWDWLARLVAECSQHNKAQRQYVLTCSALKKSYRDYLRAGLPGVTFVFLEASIGVIESRVSNRKDHFMPVSLVHSQLATLERPVAEADVITVSADLSFEMVLAQVRTKLERAS